MRTVRDNLLRALPYSQSLERFNVFSSKLLKQQLVTDPPYGLTRATFEIAKHGEVDIRCLHDFHNAASDLLQTAVISRSAADPVEHFAIGIVLHVWDAKASSPRHAILHRHPPRVAGAIGFLQRVSWRSTKPSVGDEGPPHVHDKPQRAYAERANVHASGAGRTRPESLVQYNISGERRLRTVRRNRP